MSDKIVRVEVARRSVIMVRHITVDPNEAIHGSVRSLFCTAGLTPEMWNGGKSERTRLAELGVTSEAKVDIPLFFPQEEFSTNGARIALFKEGLGYGLPYCLTPLMESAEVRKALLEKGIWWVAALGPENEKLLLSENNSHPVCVGLRDTHFGFFLGFAERRWLDRTAAVGSPQLSY
ncbi:MAG TPA: hypothetical protein PLX55_02665 [bacterium]|jgi:hypothetical protein|nr:hypothetical protein [bacterium]